MSDYSFGSDFSIGSLGSDFSDFDDIVDATGDIDVFSTTFESVTEVPTKEEEAKPACVKKIHVKTFIRIRPQLDEKEIGSCLSFDTDDRNARIKIQHPEDESRIHTFTEKIGRVFDKSVTQVEFFEATVKPMVEKYLLKGFDCAVLFYGQSRSGKTFCQEGTSTKPGLIQQTSKRLFDLFRKSPKHFTYVVQCSWCLIYKEEGYDLLGKDTKKKLQLRINMKKEFVLQNLTKYICKSNSQIQKVFKKGQQARIDFFSPMSPGGRHCHTIFEIIVQSVDDFDLDNRKFRSSKIQFVDLQCSERQKMVGKARQEEILKINWGITCLGNVIMAASYPNSRHIPYRDSKITKLLQNTIGGRNCQTLFVGNLIDSAHTYNETLFTLRYTYRVSGISNFFYPDDHNSDADVLKTFLTSIDSLNKKKKKNGDGDDGWMKKSDEKAQIMENMMIVGQGYDELEENDMQERIQYFLSSCEDENNISIGFGSSHNTIWKFPKLLFF